MGTDNKIHRKLDSAATSSPQGECEEISDTIDFKKAFDRVWHAAFKKPELGFTVLDEKV